VAEFRYIPSPEFHSSHLQQIQSGILRKLGDDFRLVLREVEEVEKTPRGKHTWLVSKL
jgi:phenylacetate-CoA ligase